MRSRRFMLLMIAVTALESSLLIETRPSAHILVAAEKSEPLDLNTASVEQLKTLPGIRDDYAFKIIKSRPYKRKDELVQKKIVPQVIYEKIQDRVRTKGK